ncbi:hypothetical protein JCM8097_004990 [Rhodosporidiobolus ruineniae]
MEPPDDLSDSEYIQDTPATLPDPLDKRPLAPPALKQSTLNFHQTPPSVYLPQLNPAQREAVTASREGGLAVHAGPGSGKTKVLTTRVAWLIQEAKVNPEELVVVTFTNKAANEMKHRLSKIVGAETVDKVVMGTFHSVCVRYLRKYAKLVGLSSNFLITDRDDCLAIIKRLLLLDFVPATLKRELKPNNWLEHISRCKARMMSPDMYRASRMSGGQTLSISEEEKVEAMARMHEAYEDELAKANALDFDDLLVRGYELFSKHPRVVGKIQSVLIDEFQDTNTVQYDIVKLIARASGSITIVGDPDQSIYGWRNAEIENLEKMLSDFKPVKQIFLEQNYRSTGAILGAALAVVRQDKNRINKSLVASHPSGSSVVLHHAPSATEEATFIASSIKHLVAHLGGLVSYNDVAVLIRYGALSRAVETALQRAGVPSRMVGGHKFFERSEIKDILSYLQLIHNPSYTPALLRVINVPRRGLGDKTLKELQSAAERKKITAFEVCVKIVNGHEGLGLVKGLTTGQRKALRGLVECVRDGRKMADEGADVADLIDYVCNKVQYQQYLEKTQHIDAAERWENVKELKAYATIVASENPASDLATALEENEDEAGESQFDEVAIPGAGAPKDDDDSSVIFVEPEEEEDGDDGEEKMEVPLSSQAAIEGRTTPLEVFLATSMLATDTDTNAAKDDAKADKVTISTCHAAKGLEWPIVFVPACENGTYPFFKSTEQSEIDEERRLLYVAITRAQGFCFLSYANSRMAGAEVKQKELTPFISSVPDQYKKALFVPKLQKITQKTRTEIAGVLGRPVPKEEVAARMIEEYKATQPVEPVSYDPVVHGSSSGSRNYSTFGSSGRYGGGFSSSSGNPFGASQASSQGRYGASGGFTTGSGQSLGRWSNTGPGSASQPQPVPAGQGGFRPASSVARSGITVTTAGFDSLPTPSSSAPSAAISTGLPPPPKAKSGASNPYAAAAAAAAAKPNPWRAGARNLAAKASTGALPTPPSSAQPAPQRAFKPPSFVNPSVPSLPSSSISVAASLPTPPPTQKPADGLPLITETRSSLIHDAVLVNPTLSAPKDGGHTATKSKDLLASFQSGAAGELDAFKAFGAGGAAQGGGRGGEGEKGAQGEGPRPPQSPERYGRGKRAAPLRKTAGGAPAKKAKQ